MNNLIQTRKSNYSDNKLDSLAYWFKNKFQSQKIDNHCLVHPCTIEGRPTLIYEKNFISANPRAYQYLSKYAQFNGYEIKEDRRNDFIEGIHRVKDKQAANVISIMIISACLFTPGVFAETKSESSSFFNASDSNTTVQGEDHDNFLDLDENLTKIKTQDDLMVWLLRWINKNSSFDYSLNNFPDIKQVNESRIQKIAFGHDMPASVNPQTSKIKGLFNYQDKTIYLLDTFDITREEDRAVLLHEIVHFLQFQYEDDKLFECKRKLESFAYRLQAKYLHDQNQKINITGEHIRRVSRC